MYFMRHDQDRRCGARAGASRRPAILILEIGRRMARKLLCADAVHSIQTHHPVPVFSPQWGPQQAKSWLDEVELDDRVLIFLLFGPRYGREIPEATKQNPK